MNVWEGKFESTDFRIWLSVSHSIKSENLWIHHFGLELWKARKMSKVKNTESLEKDQVVSTLENMISSDVYEPCFFSIFLELL